MCNGPKKCADCKKGKTCSSAILLVVQQGDTSERPMLVWGPASVETVSQDQKLIRMEALEAALPQLIRRGRLSILHKDQLVGEILAQATVGKDAAASSRAASLTQHMAGEFRTGIYVVTREIAQAFPKLQPFVGTPQLFVLGSLYGDNATARQTRREVAEGRLDSYSISGMATQSQPIEVCGKDGCKEVLEITQMDLSAATLTSSMPGKVGAIAGQASARNPAAGLILIAQAKRIIQQAGEHEHGARMERCLIHLKEQGADAGKAHRICYSTLDEAERAAAVHPDCEHCRGLLAEARSTQDDYHFMREAHRAVYENGPVAVAQAEYGDPENADPGSPEEERLTMIERRIEAVEQRVAEIHGSQPSDAKPAQPNAPEAEEDGEEEEPDGDETPEGSTQGKDKKKEPKEGEEVSQANPTPTPAPTNGAGNPQTPTNTPAQPDLASLIQQAVTAAVQPLQAKLEALEQATAALAPPAPAGGMQQARKSLVQTPEPTSGAPTTAAAGQPSNARHPLVEAAESGDPVRFKRAIAAANNKGVS